MWIDKSWRGSKSASGAETAAKRWRPKPTKTRGLCPKPTKTPSIPKTTATKTSEATPRLLWRGGSLVGGLVLHLHCATCGWQWQNLGDGSPRLCQLDPGSLAGEPHASRGSDKKHQLPIASQNNVALWHAVT